MRSKFECLASRVLSSFVLWSAVLVGPSSSGAADIAGGYPFPLAPHAVLERLKIASPAETPSIHAEERKVLEAAWELRCASNRREPPFELTIDALLAASGVETEAARAAYRNKLRKLTSEARDAVKRGKPSTHPGESLLRFLHAGVMKGGYQERQTSMAAVFETGTFNCVSSTALYYVVGRELGLDLQVVSIPGTEYSVGHAYVDLLQRGKRIAVEPTNPEGFDWEAKLRDPALFITGRRPDRKSGRRVDALGLAAMTYSNRGINTVTEYARNTNYPAAISLGLRALLCDPSDKSAARNVTAGFTNWGPALAKAGKFAEGLESLIFGYEVTKASDVKNNLCATAADWIAERLKAGGDREAQQIIKRIVALLPDEIEFKRGAPWIQYAWTCRDEQGPEAALAVIERALAATPGTDHPNLREYRVTLFRRMSEDLLDRGDYDGSLEVLERALKLEPQSGELREVIARHVRSALRDIDRQAAAPAAAAHHYRLVTTKFPQIEAVTHEALSHAQEAVEALCEEEQFEDALAAAAAYAPLAKTPGEARGISARVWELWARRFADKKDWNGSLEKLREGLKAFPGDDGLSDTAKYVIDAWAKASIDVADWNAAVHVYDRGIACFPDNGHFKDNREYCVVMRNEERRTGRAAIMLTATDR
jgi:tetratricopeptide (TPR) repeat protein